jgi:hypothetical protein
MAKAYAPPKGYDYEPDYGNWQDWQKHENAYIKRLRSFCKKNSDSKNPLVGEIIKTPMADSYAFYMVYRTKPLELIHVPIGDAWHADNIWLRGLRLADVKKMVENEKAIAKLFSK